MKQPNSLTLNIFCDGGSRGNPGPAAVGVVIKNYKHESVAAFGKFIGRQTNNIAEYTAVSEAITYLNLHNIKAFKINFYLDSMLVVNQLAGNYKIKTNHLKILAEQIKLLILSLNAQVSYTYIPREKNWQADRLVNKALDQYLI